MEPTKRQNLYNQMLNEALMDKTLQMTISYWAKIISSQWEMGLDNTYCDGVEERSYALVKRRESEDGKTYKITVATIAEGLSKLGRGQVEELGASGMRYWRNAFANAAKGEFAYTSDDLDQIIQIGLFGHFLSSSHATPELHKTRQCEAGLIRKCRHDATVKCSCCDMWLCDLHKTHAIPLDHEDYGELPSDLPPSR